MKKIESIKFPKPNISKSHRRLFENEKVFEKKKLFKGNFIKSIINI